jgi:hypothetical protein
MKKMIFYFILVLLLSPLLAIAQSANQSKTSFALLGGINFQNLNGKDINGDKLENDLMVGYHAGINIQIPIAPEFFFQPGLLFTTKGAKHTEGSVTTTYKLSNIELPLNVVYKALLGNGYFMLGAGPYIGFGIGGKVLTKGGSVSLKTDIEYKNVVETNDPFLVTYFKAFDAGGNIFAGYELANGVFFHLNTQLGMLKINPEDRRFPNDKSSVKNTGFGFSVGYRF